MQSISCDRVIAPWPDVTQRTVHLTFTPVYRFAMFKRTEYARDILHILGTVAHRHSITLHEGACMHEHIHLLVSFDRSRHLETDIVKKLKGASAREFLKKFQSHVPHLWGKKKHFEDVTSEEQFETVIRYIQENPEKDGISSEGRILSQLRIDYLKNSHCE